MPWMRVIPMLALLLCMSAGAQQVDPAKGAGLFATHCAECHSVREGKDKKGPSLFGIVGRKSAMRNEFAYSQPMRDSNIVWTPERLTAYLENPKKVVPGGKMKYDGLPSEKDRADLIGYLSNVGR